MTNLRRRIRNILLEALIGMALVTAFAVYVVKTHDSTKVRNWTPIIQLGNTALVFGFLIQWFRYAWSRGKFWAFLIVLLLIHIALYMLLLARIHQLPLVYYALLDMCELALFQRILATWDCSNKTSPP
jgi:hypothetical protein